MCTTVKSPTPRPVEEKDPIYMRNPWLDGLGIGAEARGRNSLRIDLGGTARRPGAVPATQPTTPRPRIAVRGGGGLGGLGVGGGTGGRGLSIGSGGILP